MEQIQLNAILISLVNTKGNTCYHEFCDLCEDCPIQCCTPKWKSAPPLRVHRYQTAAKLLPEDTLLDILL